MPRVITFLPDNFFGTKLNQRRWSVGILRGEKNPWVDNGRIILLLGIAHWGVYGVDLLLVEVPPLDLLHVVWTQQAREILQHVAVFSTWNTAPASTVVTKAKSIPPVIGSSHMSCLEYAIKSILNRVLVHETFQKENSSLESGFRMAVIKFQDSCESCFSNFTNRNIVLPLQ